MTWTHSYTDEAYTIVYCLLYGKSKRWLAEAYQSYLQEKDTDNDTGQVKIRGVSYYAKLPKDILVDACHEAILDTFTCSNGGFSMYVDSQGWYSIDLGEWDTLSEKLAEKLYNLTGFDGYMPTQHTNEEDNYYEI